MSVLKSKLRSPPLVPADSEAVDGIRIVQPEYIRLLNIKEAARFLGTTDKTLYTKVWRREIPFVKLGRSVRFDVRDLEALIERSRIKAVEI
jgi:excisionase family DNA binding protein